MLPCPYIRLILSFAYLVRIGVKTEVVAVPISMPAGARCVCNLFLVFTDTFPSVLLQNGEPTYVCVEYQIIRISVLLMTISFDVASRPPIMKPSGLEPSEFSYHSFFCQTFLFCFFKEFIALCFQFF